MTPRATEPLRCLLVTTRYAVTDASPAEACCEPVVAALRARGDEVRVLSADEDGPAIAGVERGLHWFRGADGTWRRPARLEASRMSRHALLRLGGTLQVFRAQVVVLGAMGGLPLTLVGASGLPELALVHDDWPAYGPQVDLKARQDGWDPGAVAVWSCATPALGGLVEALPVDPARVAVDPPGPGWADAILRRLDALAGG